jgi:hypothetical protein
MQNLKTWSLWTKARLRNLFATQGSNNPKPTNEIGNTHKIITSASRLVTCGPPNHILEKTTWQTGSLPNPQKHLALCKPKTSHRVDKVQTHTTRLPSTKQMKFFCNRFFLANEKYGEKNIVHQLAMGNPDATQSTQHGKPDNK